MSEAISDNMIEEMKTYYSARAKEYDEWFFRQGRYDRGPEMNALWFRELRAMCDRGCLLTAALNRV